MKSMKKILIILTVCLFSSYCSSQKSITDYIQNEIKTKKENNIKNLLITEKANSKALVKIYGDQNPFVKEFWAKEFDRSSLEVMKYRYEYYSNPEYWSNKNELGFDKMISLKEYQNLISKIDTSKFKTHIYSLSEPLFNKDKDRALIYKVTISSVNKPICEIILFKKSNNNWIIDKEIRLLIKDMHE